MAQRAEYRGSTLTAAAFVGAFLGVFLLPLAVLHSAQFGLALFLVMVLVVFVLDLLILLAVAGLSAEIEGLHRELERAREAQNSSGPQGQNSGQD